MEEEIERLEEMARRLGTSMERLIQIADECGLEIHAKEAGEADGPLRHC